MKQLIIDVLEDMSKGQINLTSEAARKTIANAIITAIKTNNGRKGWVLDLSTLDGKPKSIEETEKAKWICEICGKNTFHVDFDYIGSNYNHLSCELKVELDQNGEDPDITKAYGIK